MHRIKILFALLILKNKELTTNTFVHDLQGLPGMTLPPFLTVEVNHFVWWNKTLRQCPSSYSCQQKCSSDVYQNTSLRNSSVNMREDVGITRLNKVMESKFVSFEHNRICQCDHGCLVYGDCCYDFFGECADFDEIFEENLTYKENIPTMSEDEIENSRLQEAFALKRYTACQATNKISKKRKTIGYYMISLCPQNISRADFVEKCERSDRSFYNIPVTLKRNPRIVYKNIYCAFCHGKIVDDVLVWDKGMGCLKQLSKTWLNDPEATPATGCFIQTQPPSDVSPYTRSCLPFLEPKFKSTSLENKYCRIYQYPLQLEYVATNNPHCSIGLEANPKCIYLSDLSGKESAILEITLITYLFGFRFTDDYQIDVVQEAVKVDQAFSTNELCPITDVYDLDSSECVRKRSADLQKFVTVDVALKVDAEKGLDKTLIFLQYAVQKVCRMMDFVDFEIIPHPFKMDSNVLIRLNITCGTLGVKNLWSFLTAARDNLLRLFTPPHQKLDTGILKDAFTSDSYDLRYIEIYNADKKLQTENKKCINISPGDLSTEKESVYFEANNYLQSVYYHDMVFNFKVYPKSKYTSLRNISLCRPLMAYGANCTYVKTRQFYIQNKTTFIRNKNETYRATSFLLENDTLTVCDEQLVLLRNKTIRTRRKSQFEKIVEKITKAGLIISLVGLFFTFLTYTLFKELRTIPGMMVMCMSGTLALTIVLLLIRSFGTSTKSFCLFVAIGIHFALLSTYCWISSLSHDLSVTFRAGSVVSAGVLNKSRLLKYAVFSVGLPAAIVLVSAVVGVFTAVDDQLNGLYDSEVTCWIRSLEVNIYVFTVPIAAILVLNSMFFTRTIYGIHSVAKLQHLTNHTKGHLTKSLLYLKLALVMGATWVLFYVALLTNSNAILLISELLNSLQGVYIFVLFVCKKSVMRMFDAKLKLSGDRSSSYNQSDTTKTNSGMRNTTHL